MTVPSLTVAQTTISSKYYTDASRRKRPQNSSYMNNDESRQDVVGSNAPQSYKNSDKTTRNTSSSIFTTRKRSHPPRDDDTSSSPLSSTISSFGKGEKHVIMKRRKTPFSNTMRFMLASIYNSTNRSLNKRNFFLVLLLLLLMPIYINKMFQTFFIEGSPSTTTKTTLIIMGYSLQRLENYKTMFLAYGNMEDELDRIIFLWNS